MVKSAPHTQPATAEFPLPVPLPQFKAACRNWLRTFDPAVFYDSNEYRNDRFGRYEALIAAGSQESLQPQTATGSFDQLQNWINKHSDWAFGYLSYDLKNDTENLRSDHPDLQEFPVLHFFRPRYVIEVFAERLRIHSHAEAPSAIFRQIAQAITAPPPSIPSVSVSPFRPRLSRSAYLDTVQRLRKHIIEGDIYEVNFCQEFATRAPGMDPLDLFERLNQESPAPFAAYFHLGNNHLISASPERFLYKSDHRLISQPIKGTIRRDADPEMDARLVHQLATSEKDRAENIMIVDLVRNDLARSCEPGSVQVPELCEIYSFQQVHQMISTVEGKLREDVHYIDALKAAFPMGSMTGAPKVKSMELIEQYERSRRGLYSGAVGYITPEGDFDFNVVIRSLFYRTDTGDLSYQVGGAIVYDSDPEAEYRECLLKASGMLRAVGVEKPAAC